MGEQFRLKLFVSGRTLRVERAVEAIRRICQDDLQGECDLEVVDVLEHPELAERNRILATPTLIKELPPPLRRVIGDLTSRDKVLEGLDFHMAEMNGEPKGAKDPADG
ncbi:circadian clock KaiB family protein [Phycisphaerales bacterium AB-hyl4]|uniref:Circadian clock KaiB family protein n=1 Tax=Natronomicrosphaera hydrolytica TaxID=3242702 RepID=A0ABV4U095_9BACT